MNFLEKMGVDTPQEFMLLFLTVALEIVLGVAYFQGKVDNVEILFMNPLVGYWLGIHKNGESNGESNGAESSRHSG